MTTATLILCGVILTVTAWNLGQCIGWVITTLFGSDR